MGVVVHAQPARFGAALFFGGLLACHDSHASQPYAVDCGMGCIRGGPGARRKLGKETLSRAKLGHIHAHVMIFPID